jgi:class 3 adenylate cyclase
MSDSLKDRLPGEDQASIQSAEELALLWWEQQKKKPGNILKRVETAAILSNQPVPTDTREGITATIRFALKTITSIPLDKKLIEVQLKAYERGELNLFDLFQFELGQIAALKLTENPEVLKILHKINIAAYKAQKGALDGDFRADASSALDKAIDRTKKVKLKKPIEFVLAKIQEILSIISKFKNVRLLHFDPEPDCDDLIAFNYPMNKRQNRLKNNPYADVQKALTKEELEDLDEDPNIRRWKKYEDERGDLEVEYIEVPTNSGGCKLVYKLSFGEEEFGYIEYEFEDDGVHKLVKSKCSSVSAMMDTFLNDRLKEDIKKLIDKKKREIQKKLKPHHWPAVFTKLSEYLSQIIERPFVITCDRKPGMHDTPLVVEVNGKEARILDDISDSKINGESFKIRYEDEEGAVQVSEIIFDPLDEKREGIIEEAVSFFEGIVQWRESRRESHMSNVGLLPADLKIDDNLEEEPTEHDFAVLYADVDDYSTIMTQLAVDYPEKKHPLSEIMGEFFADSKRIIEKEFNVVVDKFVGDEIIILIGAPFDKEGRDAFGDLEPDFAKYIETSYEVSLRLQQLLDEISAKIETKLGITLPKPLRFACGTGLLFGAPIGVYGNLDIKGAGADYTSISPQMNLIARVLGNADGDEFLMDLQTYEKYIECGGTKLRMIGEPYEVPAKGAPNGRAMVVKIAKK